jgi:hypothetical protein
MVGEATCMQRIPVLIVATTGRDSGVVLVVGWHVGVGLGGRQRRARADAPLE